MNARKLIALAVAVLLVASYLYLKSRPRDDRTIFKGEGCITCHVFEGIGSGIIDLTGVTGRRTDEWIRVQITDPRQHDPGSGMPSFGHLSDREIDALLMFLHGDE